jgi:ferric enterobactin receptor
MKKLILLSILYHFGLFAQAQTGKSPIIIKEEYVNYQTLKNTLEFFKTKYGFKINYDDVEIKDFYVTYLFNNATAEQAVETCLRETPLKYTMTEDGEFSIYDPRKVQAAKVAADKLKFQGKSVQQNFNLKGIVKDAKSGEPLPFVNIVIVAESKGATSNVDGYFTLMKVPSDTCTLEVSYIGYKLKTIYLSPKKVKALEGQDFLIELEQENAILEEIVVSADREELLRASEKTSMLKLSPSKITALPSVGEKDIMRAFQLMPGVSAANENSSGLYVRGGTPDQTLVLYDGFNVYHVEHLFGFFSAFNPNAIKDVQLYKGGFESKFGGRIGSVAEITGKEGNSKNLNLGLDAGFLAANAFIEAPIGDKMTGLFAVRRSYQTSLYDAIFKKYSGTRTAAAAPPGGGGPGGFGNRFNTSVSSYFYDMNGKITYKPTPKDVITLSLYNGTDNLDNSRKTNFNGGAAIRNFNLNTSDLTYWGNLGGSLKWSRRFSQAFYVNTLVSYSNYYSLRDRSSTGTITQPDGTILNIKRGTLEDNNLKDFSAKLDFEWKANSKNNIEFGLSATQNSIKYTYAQNDTSTIIDRNTSGATVTGFVQDKIKLFKNLEGNLGVRYTYFQPTAKGYVEPRASLTYQLLPSVKLKAAYGVYNQFAKRVIREDVFQGSRDFWVLADENKLPVASATHYIIGANWESAKWLFDVEAYRKDLSGLTEYSLRINSNPRQTANYSERFYQGTGVARGIDILLQKKYGQLNGWLAYSLGEVPYNFPDLNKTVFYANQDVRHEFKAVGIYRLGKWDLSATWIYASGRPYTAPEGGYNLTLLDGSLKSYINISEKNAYRLPAYHRLDIAATYTWKGSAGGARSIGFSLFNLYDRQNVWYKEFEIQNNQLIETNVNYLGITPNLNISWRLR